MDFLRIFRSLLLPCIILLFCTVCKGDILNRMMELKKEGKYFELVILCHEHPEAEYKEICDQAWSQAGQNIDQILSQQAEMPFLRVSVDEKTRKQVEDILSKNEQLKERYLPLWKKFVQE